MQGTDCDLVNSIDGVAGGADHVLDAAILADARHFALKARFEIHRFSLLTVPVFELANSATLKFCNLNLSIDQI